MIWLMVLALSAAVTLSIEFLWRSRDYRPNVLDSMQLWSQQRDRVYANDRTPLVLLGASRIEFGVDMTQLQALLPRYRPVMLALNGRYPIAALKDLADDPAFRGVVICDIEPNGLLRERHALQQAYVDYYHRQWTPNWRLHRTLLTHWQQTALIADPRFGVVASLRHAVTGGEPFRDYIRFHADRSGDIDFQRTDPAATKRHFEANVEQGIAALPQRSAQEWFDDLRPVFDGIRKIQARGGQVILFQSPLKGQQRSVNLRLFPDEQYWNRLASASPGPVLDANGVEALTAFDLPDDSHLDYRNKPAYTRALVETLVSRGLLDGRPASTEASPH